MKTTTLTQFFGPASKRTISCLSLIADLVEENKQFTNWDSIRFQGWYMSAISEPHYWCGFWRTIGCLNNTLHEKLGKGGFYYVKRFQRSCYRGVCKTCYLKWIARQANNSTRRIETYSIKNHGKKPIHLILSAPTSQHNVPVKILRQRMSHILKLGKIEGGAVIFHPFRFNKKIQQWYAYPHFHLVGFGNHNEIRNAFGRYGWYVKDVGERNSTFQTFCYLLSHCGIQKGYKTVTWFGNLSYSNLHVEKEPRITRCPICEGEFVEVYYENEVHPVVPPDKHYEGLVESEGWHPVITVENLNNSCSFEYASVGMVNDVLKGLVEAN